MVVESRHQYNARILRAYRMTFAASVGLAAIGAPLLMQGAVALASGISSAAISSGALLWGLLWFGLSAVPMALAGYAWRLTQSFQRTLDEDD